MSLGCLDKKGLVTVIFKMIFDCKLDRSLSNDFFSHLSISIVIMDFSFYFLLFYSIDFSSFLQYCLFIIYMYLNGFFFYFDRSHVSDFSLAFFLNFSNSKANRNLAIHILHIMQCTSKVSWHSKLALYARTSSWKNSKSGKR